MFGLRCLIFPTPRLTGLMRWAKNLQGASCLPLVFCWDLHDPKTSSRDSFRHKPSCRWLGAHLVVYGGYALVAYRVARGVVHTSLLDSARRA